MWQLSCNHDPSTATTCLKDFLIVLKRILQNYWKILKKRVLGTTRIKCLHVPITNHTMVFSSFPAGLTFVGGDRATYTYVCVTCWNILSQIRFNPFCTGITIWCEWRFELTTDLTIKVIPKIHSFSKNS